jgi:hypothetical protein
MQLTLHEQLKNELGLENSMSNGEGCKCYARSSIECACGVNWNQKPLSDEEIFKLSMQCDLNHILGLIDYGRAIEKAHGIGK